MLKGPHAHAYSDLNDNNTFSANEEIDRTAGHFKYPFTPFTGSTCDPDDAPCSWDPNFVASWLDNREQNGVQAFYLVNRFQDHLAQDPNILFNGFSGADAVRVESDDGAGSGPDGAHLNNASMSTLPEGIPPLMQLYLFDGQGFRTVNAGDSAAIVWHEYTHGLSNRLVVHDDGSGALPSAQAGAMGEGWSDWYALDLLAGENPLFDDLSVAGDVDLGHYVDAIPHQLASRASTARSGSRRAAPVPLAREQAASRTATSPTSSTAPRSMQTVRSGPRRCGTCAPRSAATPRRR